MSATSTTRRLCPACLSEKVSRSRRRGLERLLTLLPIRPYRCRHCKTRFWRFRLWEASR